MPDQESIEEAQHDLLLIIFTALTILISTGLAVETGEISQPIVFP
ncbi:hypothetical protein [Desulfotruncus alcoholivorax]|nr:hypothetical protein [Desulfotruncus alcoholivorax]